MPIIKARILGQKRRKPWNSKSLTPCKSRPLYAEPGVEQSSGFQLELCMCISFLLEPIGRQSCHEHRIQHYRDSRWLHAETTQAAEHVQDYIFYTPPPMLALISEVPGCQDKNYVPHTHTHIYIWYDIYMFNYS